MFDRPQQAIGQRLSRQQCPGRQGEQKTEERSTTPFHEYVRAYR